MIKDAERVVKVYNMGCAFAPESLIPVDGTIVFFEADLLCIARPYEYGLILTLNIAEYDVCCILIDQGSSTNLLYVSAYKQMSLMMNALKSPGKVLMGFNALKSRGMFCYNIMSFNLKNARATYQWLVTKLFQPLLGKSA